MNSSVLKSAILGGLVVYLWGVISWMVLPWHNAVIHPFSHDADVATVLDFATPSSGIYSYPGPDRNFSQAGGPLAFVSVAKEGSKPKALCIVIALVMQILGAFLVSWMLSRTQGLDYRRKVLFVVVFGVAVAWLGAMPYWIWWGFSSSYTVLSMADAAIGWTLAGLVIAKIIP